VLTGLVLLTVTLTAILIHLTWFYAARRNVADVVRQLNRQIVGSVQHEVRGTLNDAWSVQEAVRSIFFQEAVKPTDEAKREFIFLALPRSHPTLSWIALGFPDGAFFGALRTTDDEIDMVEVKQNPATGIRRQRVDTYTPQPGDVMFSRTRDHPERLRGGGANLVPTRRCRGRPGHTIPAPAGSLAAFRSQRARSRYR
jgi:adenylate cyclase